MRMFESHLRHNDSATRIALRDPRHDMRSTHGVTQVVPAPAPSVSLRPLGAAARGLRLPVSCRRRRRSARTRDPCSCGLNWTGSHVAHSVSHGERYRLSRQPHRSQTPGGAVGGSRRSTVFQKWPTFRQGSPRSCVTPCLQPRVIAARLVRCQALRRRASQVARGRNTDTRERNAPCLLSPELALANGLVYVGESDATTASLVILSQDDATIKATLDLGGNIGPMGPAITNGEVSCHAGNASSPTD